MNIEEGIIKAKAILDNHREIDKMMVIEMVELIETLLTAYEKEKEKNEKIKNATIVQTRENGETRRLSINKMYYEIYKEINKKWEDKIKAKIKEADKIIDEDKDFINKNLNSIDGDIVNWYYQKVDLNVRIRNILESLLEKE